MSTLSEIAEEVERTHQRVNITRNGRSYVVLVSAQDLESLEATLELLSDPDALVRVARAQTDLAAGQQVTQDQTAAEMEQRRHLERPGAPSRRRHPAAGAVRGAVTSPARRVQSALPHRRDSTHHLCP